MVRLGLQDAQGSADLPAVDQSRWPLVRSTHRRSVVGRDAGSGPRDSCEEPKTAGPRREWVAEVAPSEVRRDAGTGLGRDTVWSSVEACAMR